MRSRRFLSTTRVGRVIAVGVVVLVVAGVAVAIAVNREQSTDTANDSCHVEPQGSGSGMRALPTGLYRGITFADESSADAAALDDQVATITALPHMPVTRVVFDPDTDPLEYCGAINALQPVSYLLGELVDSESIKNLDGAEYEQRAVDYLDAFGASVDLWEVGNEVNGNWTGKYSDVADKITRATDVVKARKKRAALTLWENSFGEDHCGNGSDELTPVEFSKSYLPAATRAKMDHVTVSWYPTECTGKPNGNSNNVPVTQIKAEMVAVHELYPNATIGFGELGLPDAVTSATLTSAQAIADYYYRLGTLDLSYYVGGYYWWYSGDDIVPKSKPMFATIAGAMK